VFDQAVSKHNQESMFRRFEVVVGWSSIHLFMTLVQTCLSEIHLFHFSKLWFYLARRLPTKKCHRAAFSTWTPPQPKSEKISLNFLAACPLNTLSPCDLGTVLYCDSITYSTSYLCHQLKVHFKGLYHCFLCHEECSCCDLNCRNLAPIWSSRDVKYTQYNCIPETNQHNNPPI
jgi:hypothetical protein